MFLVAKKTIGLEQSQQRWVDVFLYPAIILSSQSDSGMKAHIITVATNKYILSLRPPQLADFVCRPEKKISNATNNG